MFKEKDKEEIVNHLYNQNQFSCWNRYSNWNQIMKFVNKMGLIKK